MMTDNPKLHPDTPISIWHDHLVYNNINSMYIAKALEKCANSRVSTIVLQQLGCFNQTIGNVE